jgi:uncharacterized membrane protein
MRKWLPVGILAATWLLSALVYPDLPARMATHWDLGGQPDGWGGRAYGAFVVPIAMTVAYALMAFVPRIDPRAEHYRTFMDSYELVVSGALGALALVHLSVIGTALGWNTPVARVVPIAVGALFVLIGGLLPRTRSNFFFGIRTPWTLSSERVWERTHRVGGIMMVASGLMMMGAAFARGGIAFSVVIAAALLAGFGTVGYSYWVWRQEGPR